MSLPCALYQAHGKETICRENTHQTQKTRQTCRSPCAGRNTKQNTVFAVRLTPGTRQTAQPLTPVGRSWTFAVCCWQALGKSHQVGIICWLAVDVVVGHRVVHLLQVLKISPCMQGRCCWNFQIDTTLSFFCGRGFSTILNSFTSPRTVGELCRNPSAPTRVSLPLPPSSP